MSWRSRASILVLFVIVLSLLLPVPVLAKPAKTCGPITASFSSDMPPEGFVAFQETRIDDNCKLVVSAVQLVPENQLQPSPAEASATFSSAGESLPAPSGTASIDGSASGCCWAGYAVQRSWDCCGIKMNEYWTQLQFNRCSGGYCSPYLRTWGAQDGGAWHTEVQYPGWYPNCCDHWLRRTSGGVGYASVAVQGHQGYSYRGVFDTGGNDYYNSYTNNLSGNTTGNWSCSYSYYWKKSAPGWHTQSWCGSGYYPG